MNASISSKAWAEVRSLLIVTPSFLPSVGGIENVARTLADASQNEVERITVCCPNSSDGWHDPQATYSIIRRPKLGRLWSLYREHDRVIILQGTSSLGWPALLFPRKCLLVYGIWVRWKNRPSIAGFIGGMLMRWRVQSVACSETVGLSLQSPYTVVPNPYDQDTFKLHNRGLRPFDVCFVGRMISWKGVPVLLEALMVLRSRGLRLECVLCGDGPDRIGFRKLAQEMGVQDQLTWRDSSPANVVADIMNQSKVACIPSTWDEPFGIVALEAMACGCKVVATSAGGLPDAVGQCGRLFPKGDAGALAAALEQILDSWQPIAVIPPETEQHLYLHTGGAISSRFLQLLER